MESEEYKLPATIGELMDRISAKLEAIGFKEILEPPKNSHAEKAHR